MPITSPAYYRDLALDDAASVFRSDSSEAIPLLDERVRVMREAGEVLCQVYSSSGPPIPPF